MLTLGWLPTVHFTQNATLTDLKTISENHTIQQKQSVQKCTPGGEKKEDEEQEKGKMSPMKTGPRTTQEKIINAVLTG